MATKKKKVRSHVKRVKLQQKKNPVSQEKYEKRLKVARKKDFFRRLRNVIVILAIAFCALFAAGNLMLKKATGQTLIGCMREAKDLVDSSTPDTFRLAQTSYIYSDDGTQLAALAESEDATYLSYEDIPADVVNASFTVTAAVSQMVFMVWKMHPRSILAVQSVICHSRKLRISVRFQTVRSTTIR